MRIRVEFKHIDAEDPRLLRVHDADGSTPEVWHCKDFLLKLGHVGLLYGTIGTLGLLLVKVECALALVLRQQWRLNEF